MMQLSQINGPDLAPEVNANITLSYLKQVAQVQTAPLEELLTSEARQEFASFLRNFRSAVDEEAKEDDEALSNQREFVEEQKKAGGAKPVDPETLKKIESIVSGEIVKECIDPSVPYPEITEELKNKLVTDQPVHWLLGTDFKRDPAVGVEILNQEWINGQKKVIGFIIKGMGKNLLEGKSIMGMSLPISIFSGDSILQRAAKCMTYAPLYLKKAGEAEDPLEQFKQAITFYFTIMHLGIEQQKPFNPILGETYQGLIGGEQVLLEQISHHPPISYIHVSL